MVSSVRKRSIRTMFYSSVALASCYKPAFTQHTDTIQGLVSSLTSLQCAHVNSNGHCTRGKVAVRACQQHWLLCARGKVAVCACQQHWLLCQRQGCSVRMSTALVTVCQRQGCSVRMSTALVTVCQRQGCAEHFTMLQCTCKPAHN